MYMISYDIDWEKGFKVKHFPNDSFEDFTDVHEKKDRGGNHWYSLFSVMKLHFYSVFDPNG